MACAHTCDERELIELLARLVSIDSRNPRLDPAGPGEARIAGTIAGWLDRAGLDVTVVDAAPGRPNVYGRAQGYGDGPTLLLLAHTDTVGFGAMESPLEPRIEGDCMRGRGTYDMKAGLAAIMWAGRAAVSARLRGDVIVACVADEEHGSVGTERLLLDLTADAAVVAEPTGAALDLGVAHKGFVWLEIETYGHAAHGSRPDEGVDAIVDMGHVLVALDRRREAMDAEEPHRLLGTPSLHASLIAGGVELSTYPDRCRLGLELRTLPGTSGDDALAEVRRTVEQARNWPRSWRADVELLLARPGFEIEPHAPVVAEVRAAARACDVEASLVGLAGWNESALLATAGIPTVVFGPGGGGAHAAEEWVDLRQIVDCARILGAVAERLCGGCDNTTGGS